MTKYFKSLLIFFQSFKRFKGTNAKAEEKLKWSPCSRQIFNSLYFENETIDPTILYSIFVPKSIVYKFIQKV